MRKLFASVFIVLLLLGCSAPSLGLKTPQDCDTRITSSDQDRLVQSDPKYKLVCFHEAAISAAYGYNGQTIEDARELCREIRSLPLANAESMRTTQSNQCFYDIALIAARNGYFDEHYANLYNMPLTNLEGICNEITSSNVDSVLKGEEVTKESCSRQTERLRSHGPATYQQNRANLCSVAMLLLPFLGLAVYLRR